MLSLGIRRAAVVVVLTATSTLIPLSGLHAAPRERARKEPPSRVRAVSLTSFFGNLNLISVVWAAAGLRIDDNGVKADDGVKETVREDAGLRIDDNG